MMLSCRVEVVSASTRDHLCRSMVYIYYVSSCKAPDDGRVLQLTFMSIALDPMAAPELALRGP